jgi:hypothetical protein
MGTAETREGGPRVNGRVQTVLNMLNNGECEPAKAAVHAVLMATVALCAAYNTAAWVKRRQKHLAVNAVLYTAAVWWERCHIVHHVRSCSRTSSTLPSSKLREAA